MGDIILKNEEVIIKLLLAVIVGGFTGYEREKSNQFAGFRTHILVSIGSCITSIIALELFTEYSSITNMDPARLPAQVLSGIGFSGAGAILKNSNGIRGLTNSSRYMDYCVYWDWNRIWSICTWNFSLDFSDGNTVYIEKL